MIGRPADHDTIDMLQMFFDLIRRFHPSVDQDFQIGKLFFSR